MRRLGPVLLALAGGCTTTTLDIFEVCELDVALTPEDGAPGDTIVARGGPFTEARDTRVEVGGYEAEILLVASQSTSTGDTAAVDLSTVCDACEECRVEAQCGPCGRCVGELLTDGRRDECFGNPLEDTVGFCDVCQQQVSFVVPSLAAGPTTVWMINRNGTSPAVPFTILGPTGTGETSDTALATGATSATADTASTAHTGSPATGSTGATASTADTALGGTAAMTTGATGSTGGTGS